MYCRFFAERYPVYVKLRFGHNCHQIYEWCLDDFLHKDGTGLAGFILMKDLLLRHVLIDSPTIALTFV